ncbi:uncharacterized protein LOC143838827 [Paroedura picta]|uniref:uncharacterized protein LOC143838827 n=1 Tax=Paroedura picta TaxID=143630 RepID=UPI004055A6CC
MEKPWIAPQVEKKKAGDERKYTIYGQKPWIPPQRKYSGDERKNNIYGQQNPWGIPQVKKKKTKKDAFEERKIMFAEIQERQTMEKLERQKRMKEGQQLLERLRESDALVTSTKFLLGTEISKAGIKAYRSLQSGH